MPSLRCSNCGLDWPVDYAHYQTCAKCKGPTWYSGKSDAMDDSTAKHEAFEAFFADREAAKLNAAMELAR